MRRHKGLKHGEGELLQCVSCDYKTPTKYLLKSHEQSKHGNSTFNCETCSFQTTTEDYLRNHSRKHNKSGIKKLDMKKTISETNPLHNDQENIKIKCMMNKKTDLGNVKCTLNFLHFMKWCSCAN